MTVKLDDYIVRNVNATGHEGYVRITFDPPTVPENNLYCAPLYVISRRDSAGVWNQQGGTQNGSPCFVLAYSFNGSLVYSIQTLVKDFSNTAKFYLTGAAAGCACTALPEGVKPTIASITPNHGDQGTPITIKGTGFKTWLPLGVANVQIGQGMATPWTLGGANIDSMVVVDDSTITGVVSQNSAAYVTDVVLVSHVRGMEERFPSSLWRYDDLPRFVSVEPSEILSSRSMSAVLKVNGTRLLSLHLGVGDSMVLIQNSTGNASTVCITSKTDSCVTGEVISNLNDGEYSLVSRNPNSQPYLLNALSVYSGDTLPERDLEITSVTPSIVSMDGGTDITIKGKHFKRSNVTVTRVSVGEAYPATNVRVVDDNTIIATACACSVKNYVDNVYVFYKFGTKAVTVSWLQGLGGCVTYKPTGASFNSITPTFCAAAEGVEVTISGAGFESNVAYSVRIADKVNATNVSVISATEIKANFPPSADSFESLEVWCKYRNIDGVEKESLVPGAQNKFTYYSPPTVSAVSPISAIGLEGATLEITGSNFAYPLAATVGDVASTVTAGENPSTQLRLTVPPGTVGAKDIVLTTPFGTCTKTGSFAFTEPLPVIVSITPISGSIYGDFPITITGRFLDGATSVMFSDIAAPIVSIAADGEKVIVTAPPGTEGAKDVRVTVGVNPDPKYTAVKRNGFAYTKPQVSKADDDAARSAFNQAKAAVNAIILAQNSTDPVLPPEDKAMLAEMLAGAQESLSAMADLYLHIKETKAAGAPSPIPANLPGTGQSSTARSATQALANVDLVLAPMSLDETMLNVRAILAGTDYPAGSA